MRPCPNCDRHIREADAVCPFCATPRKTTWAPHRLSIPAAIVVCLGIGCTTRSIAEGEPDESGETGSVSTSTTEASSVSMSTTAGGSTGADDTWDDGDDTCSFYAGCPPDGGTGIECDVWNQDCPDGEKCMPWANDGGSSWNATKCVPLSLNPRAVGESCTVEGSGVSGIDDCDISAMCWSVDSDTNMGVCVGFCGGSWANPSCVDPETVCTIGNDGVLILCLMPCDPLIQDCDDGDACYPTTDEFVCTKDSSGPDQGEQGDTCEYLNACDPGLYCASADLVPGCQGGDCCTAFCNVEEVDMCPSGTACTPWFEEGEALPEQAHIGGCVWLEP